MYLPSPLLLPYSSFTGYRSHNYSPCFHPGPACQNPGTRVIVKNRTHIMFYFCLAPFCGLSLYRKQNPDSAPRPTKPCPVWPPLAPCPPLIQCTLCSSHCHLLGLCPPSCLKHGTPDTHWAARHHPGFPDQLSSGAPSAHPLSVLSSRQALSFTLLATSEITFLFLYAVVVWGSAILLPPLLQPVGATLALLHAWIN